MKKINLGKIKIDLNSKNSISTTSINHARNESSLADMITMSTANHVLLNKLINEYFIEISNPNVQCLFPNCEELKKQYKEDLDKLGKGCTACQRNGVIRKYKNKITTIIKERQGEIITDLFLCTDRLKECKMIEHLKEILSMFSNIKDHNYISPDNKSNFKKLFYDSSNAVTWGMGYDNSMYRTNNRNVLFIENGLLKQSTGLFIDSEGFFCESRLCTKKLYNNPYLIDELKKLEEHVNKCIGPFLSGGNSNGPILITLQRNGDAPMRLHYPAIKSSNIKNRILATLQILHKYLPKGPQYIIKPHPKFLSDWDEIKDEFESKFKRDDFTVSINENFYDMLKTCSGLVTVNSTTAIEALAVGIPVAVLGNHVWTGSSDIVLDCSEDLSKLKDIINWKPNEEKVKKFLCAVKRQHVSYNATKEELIANNEIKKWIGNLR